MDRLTPGEKAIIMSKTDSFHFSGVRPKISGKSICQYVHDLCCDGIALNLENHSYTNSLVGRDFKAWAQVGIFIVWPLLTTSEKNVWLSLAKVIRIIK